MVRFTGLFQEIHRRGLWQATAAFFGVAWAVLEFMDLFTDRGLLPNWTFTGALVALAIGFPVILTTAYLQTPPQDSATGTGPEDHMGKESRATGSATDGFIDSLGEGEKDAVDSERHQPRSFRGFFTWQRTLLGGVAAFAVLGVATAGFGIMRVTGIGAPGTLLAQGVIEEGGLVILADFEGTAGAEETAELVTEALRIDLEQSPTFELMDPRAVATGLARMVRDADESFTESTALELAIREGAEVVVAGEVGQVGDGFILTGRLMAAQDGALLATFRETPRDPSELIDAIDAISGKIRSKMGEALRSVAGTEPLSIATTTSVEALRKFTYVSHREPRGAISGSQAIQVIEEAIALDTTFAEAYRYLAILINNFGGSVQRGVEASQKAFQYRDRLPARDRLLVEGNYHMVATGDFRQAARAYRGLVELDSLDGTAATNLADLLMYEGEYDEAEWALGLNPRPEHIIWTWNSMATLAGQQRYVEAEALLAQAVIDQPDNVYLPATQGLFFATTGQWEKALAVMENLEDEDAARFTTGSRSVAYAQAGKLAEADVQFDLSDDLIAEDGSHVDRIGNAATRAFMRGWLGGDTEMAVRELEAFLQTLPMETISPVDRLYSLVALTFAVLGATEEAQAFLDRYTSEVPDVGDPGGRARAGVAEALIKTATGSSATAAGLDQAVERLRCARCRSFYLGQGYEFAGDGQKATEAYEAYLADGFFDASMFETHLPPPVVHERLGYLYSEAGMATKAAEHFQAFADRWSQADPALQPRVERAREVAGVPTN